MDTARAQLSTYRQSPRKTRVVADLIRGKSIAEALEILDFATKRAASPLSKLLRSAVANAKAQGMNESKLVVSEVRVDAGPTFKRIRPASRGSAHPIKKRTSHVVLTLTEKELQKRTRVTKEK